MFPFTFIWKFVFELVHADRQVSGLKDRKHSIIQIKVKTPQMIDYQSAVSEGEVHCIYVCVNPSLIRTAVEVPVILRQQVNIMEH